MDSRKVAIWFQIGMLRDANSFCSVNSGDMGKRSSSLLAAQERPKWRSDDESNKPGS
jgi:hypothetical protein